MKTRENKLIYIILILFYLIIFLPKPIQLLLFAATAITYAATGRKKREKDKFVEIQFLYLTIYLFSICVNMVSGEHETSRIFAAINTFVIDCVAIIMYIYFKNSTDIDERIVEKTSFLNISIINILAILSKTITAVNGIDIHGHTISGEDWIDGVQTSRFYGFMDYSNLVIFAVMFFFPYAVKYVRNKFSKILLCILTLYAVDLTNSRSGLVLTSILIVIYILFCEDKSIWKFINRNKVPFGILSAVILIFTLIVFHDSINNIIQRMLNERNGSNGMRMYIYSSSMNKMLNDSPFFGIGIKDLNLDGYPYGSHSSYIGAFYKTGLIGGIIYLISMLIMDYNIALKRSADNYDLIKKIALVFCTIMMIVEDIDGANWTICIFFIYCGIYLNTADRKVAI
ncbi:O-antigen ligase family protein [Bifidobacterium apri]|uniref:O-antigen ligase family protein n=1 Tax=Bifidobacterium apri TaxID=1769423 RepID=UPI0039914A6E